ncbi:hypothetical protein KR215_011153 [Drosophila sulfurigaster]|nr:hypothetical protein KR215_011153 [Drosophila sulfurigaster]
MSHIKNIIPTTVNPDLQKERSAATFDVEELAVWFQRSAEKLKTKREVERVVFANLEDGYGLNHEYMSHEDLYNSSVKKVAEAAPKLKALQKKLNPGGKDIWPGGLISEIGNGLFPANHPLATHTSMFVDVINGQGTPEQVAKWGPLAENCNIIGTYAQTELAHGTNVRGIETRADYDIRAGEFVLNTPNLEAYKWWPGGLGHTANHAMVVAQLYISGKHKGVQMFIVPLRHPETHLPLPGIDVGEIGKKLGMASVNQGFLGLKNVRIPRENMLMKFAKVDRDGKFTASPVSRVNYLTMVYTRCLIVELNTQLLLAAATIATRYSAVRRQSPIEPNGPEPQIIDHVTQRLKLFPEIATGIAYHQAAEYMWELYDQTVLDANNGKFERLPDMHILSCALKVLCSTDGCAGIERLRLSTGGHGYHIAANLSNMYGNAVASYTYEGENTVLLLQIGRALVKTWNNYTQGKGVSSSYAYFEPSMSLKEFPKWDNSWQCIVKALQYTATHKTRIAFENLSERITAGQSQGQAANNTGIELTRAAELHGRQFLCQTFVEQITGPKAQKRSKALNEVLENMLEMFLVQTVLNNLSDVLRFINLTDADLRSLQKRLEQSLEKFRPNAVAFCDGFDFHDRVLNSVLGSYDGNIYPRLFDAAKRSTMNQKHVQKSFETHLKPLMKSNL